MKQVEFKRGVAYARYSSEMQRDESIEAQLRAIQDYAQRNNIVIVGEYLDRAKSAMSDQRKEFQRMIKDSASGDFSVVIVHKLDRFSRDSYDSAHYKRILKKNGVVIRSVLENLDDTPESLMLESVLIGMAEYYSKNLARETMKGLSENARNGKHTGGVAPFGYDVDPLTKKLVINEHEATGLRLIFNRVLNGVSYSDIIDELNLLGYKGKRGQFFTSNSLNSILKNPKYTGDYYFNRSASKNAEGKRSGYKDESEFIIIPNAVPALVSHDDFDAVQAKLKTRMQTRKHSHAKENYLLTGKIFCGICGGAYVGSRRRQSKQGTIWSAYGCNKRHRAGDCACNNKELGRNHIESWIVERLADYVFSDTYRQRILNELNKYVQNRNHAYVTQREAYASQIKNSTRI